MATITADLVKQLRDKTGAGMMECKAALTEANGNMDEAVTLLSVWGTFWTAAFVLKWPEHIAFDVLFNAMAPERQRFWLLGGCIAFIVLVGAAMPGMVDYTLFLWRERTDARLLRLDYVYSIFPFFFAVVLLRLALVVRELAGAGWRRELARWSGEEDS